MMKLMKYIIVNAVLCLTYATLSYKIGGDSYDPVGTGYRFCFFVSLHLLGIIFFELIRNGPGKPKKVQNSISGYMIRRFYTLILPQRL